MADEGFKRKLTAILSADVEGYSRLMDDDEAATVRTLTSYRTAIADLVKQYHGRVVDSPGDNILAEFTSVVDAVNCAVEIQRELAEQNAELPDERKMQFRIGINLGDVIDEEERIYGDGINIAARIESLSEAGGICISHSAYDQIKNKLKFGYEYLGEHEVKNIREPVKVYRVLMAPEFEGTLIGFDKKASNKKWIWVAAAAVVVAVVGLGIWQFYGRRPTIEAASEEKMAYPLPDKPSIAVLPFDNLSGEKEQEYFCDGLSEGIISALAKNDRLFVIARNSTFTYKGKPTNVKQIAEDLGVRYVLEGSIQKAGDRVRITAQLIDALSGYHLFSERYERELKDIFRLQDEITKKVLTKLLENLTLGTSAAPYEKGTDNLDAYLKVMQARDYKNTQVTKERVLKAFQLLEEAIALDPEYAPAYSILSTAHFDLVTLGASDDPKASLKTAIELGNKAIALDESNPSVHAHMAFLYIMTKNFDKAFEEAEKAVSISPNYAGGYFALGFAFVNTGQPQKAIHALEKCLRLSPTPISSQVLVVLAGSYRNLGKYEEAIATYKKALHIFGQDQLFVHVNLARTYVLMDLEEEARAEAAEVMRIDPDFSIARFLKPWPSSQEKKDRIAAILRKAGLPFNPPLPLPDKPSIAVLPFDNMSDDPKQEYFSDGISEDIITDLSKISRLIVIARTSSFAYKGKSINVQQIGQDLRVRYLLEGSVRKAGDQVRINAQLIDASNGQHLWAERYDGKMDDIFALQDKITRKIISALALKLSKVEQDALIDKGTDNIQAYDEFLKGWQGYRLLTKEGFAEAKIHLEKAVELDPEFARAYAALAILYWKAIQYAAPELRQGLGLNNRAAKRAAQAKPQLLLKKAMKKPTALAHGLMSQLYLFRYQHDEALAEIERAVAMDPNDPELYAWLSHILWLLGKNSEAIESAKMGMRLDPINPATYLIQLGKAYIPDGNLKESFQVLERAKRLNPELSGVVALSQSIIYGIQGRYEEARTGYEIFLKHRMYPVRNLNSILLYFPFADPDKLDPIAKALIKAGAPGNPTDYYRILKEYRIRGQEIKSLIFGHKISGISMSTGKQFQWEFAESGEFKFIMGNFQDIGKSWVEEDVLFIQFKKLLGGLPYGATIYNNPDGSIEIKNQYFIVSDIGSITPFAPIE